MLLIPIFTAAQARWSAQDIFLFVGAFGAMGHHLPGMIRAYGDRALFARFKTRFIVAPLALLAVCIWSSFYNIQAVQLVAMAWGIWHGMMQTYGFCRIYDAKASAKAAAPGPGSIWRFASRGSWRRCCSRRCVSAALLDLYYESGGPVIPVAVRRGDFVRAFVIALGLVTAVFLWRQWSDWRGGTRRQSGQDGASRQQHRFLVVLQ